MGNTQGRALFACNHKLTEIRRMMFVCVVIVIMVNGIHSASTVRAYGSWVTDTGGQSIYGVAPVSGSSTQEDGTSTDTFTKKILNFCLKLPDGIRNALTGDGYNFSLDGIILGRLAAGGSGNSVNYTGFDMSDGNLYGTVGAVIYKTLRAVVLGGMLLMYMYMLATHVFKSGEKSRAELKEALMRLVIMFLLIYIMPQIVDIVIYLRDFTLSLVYRGMTSSGMVDANRMGTNAELITVYRDMAYSESGFGFFTFLLYLGVCIGCVFFLWEYMKIAIIQMMLFAIYPVVSLLSVHNKKLLSDWWGMFFSDCIIPVMDYSLLLIPVFIGEAMGEVHPMLSAIMQVAVIAQTVPARNAMLRIFTNATGIATGGGFGGLGMLGMMAMAALRRGAFHGGFGENHAGGGAELPDADTSQEIAEQFRNDLKPLYDMEQRDVIEGAGKGMDGFGAGSDVEDIMSVSDESIKDLVGNDADQPQQEPSDGAYGTEGDHMEEPVPEIENFSADNEDESVQKAEEELNAMQEGGGATLSGNNTISDLSGAGEYDMEKEPEPQMPYADTVGGVLPVDDDTGVSGMPQAVSSGNMENGQVDEKDFRSYRPASSSGGGSAPVYQQHDMEHQAQEGQGDTYHEPKALYEFNTLRGNNLKRLDEANQQAEVLQNRMSTLSEAHRGHEAVYADRRAAFESAKNECSIAKTNYESTGREYGKNSAELQEAKAQYQTAEENMRAKQGNMEEARKKLQNSQADMDKQKSAIESNRKEIKKAVAKEEQYAGIAKQYGMKDTRYGSEAEFTRQRKIDEIKRNHANYKNFNSGGFKNSLSPEERAAFSREQQLHEKYLRASRAMTVTAGVAGAVAGVATGAVIGSFGGEKGMRSGAMFGGMAGGGAAAGVTHTAANGIQGEPGSPYSDGAGRESGTVPVTERKVEKISVKSGKEQSNFRQRNRERPGDELNRRARNAARNDKEINKLL